LTWALLPAQQDLSCARIRDGALTQAAFDLGVRRGLTLSTRGAWRAKFLISLWQAWSALAVSSGYSAANADGYVTIVHPRRAAWLAAGVSGTMPSAAPLVPGQLVVSAGIPTALGAGTNEDVALIVEKSQVLLLSRGPRIVVREDVLSSTLTVRVQATRDLAVLVKNANAIAKVTGLTPPSGF
jgi:hypothetical protein